MPADCDQRNERGFTLLEMLVALALTAIVSSILVGSIQAGAQTTKRVRAHAAEADSQIAQLRVESWLASMLPYNPLYMSGEDDPIFSGSASELSFYTSGQVFPGQFGYYSIHLTLVGSQECEGARLSVEATRIHLDDRRAELPARRLVGECMSDPYFEYVELATGGEDTEVEAEQSTVTARTAGDWNKPWRLPDIIRLKATASEGKSATLLSARTRLR